MMSFLDELALMETFGWTERQLREDVSSEMKVKLLLFLKGRGKGMEIKR